MPTNCNYKGCMIPTDEDYKKTGYVDLLIERYTLGQQFVKDKSVLDTCCGTGWGTFHSLAQDSKLTIGVDLLKEAIDYYNFEKDNFNLLQMDALDLSFENDTFDVVTAFDSIEHVSKEDATKYLSELRRVMKRDGLLIGTTPLCADKCLTSLLLSMNKYHLHVYTKKNLQRLLNSYFPKVNIYEVYHETFPYLLFFCQKSHSSEWERKITDVVRNFIKSKPNSRKIKTHHYYQWSRQLLARGDRTNAIKWVLVALSHSPLSYLLWRSLLISLLPQYIVGILRATKRTIRLPRRQRHPFSRVVMYQSIRDYISNLDLGSNILVLEIGGTSYRLNTKKNWFDKLERYISINIEKDESADFVMDGSNLTFSSNSFHVVIIDQVLEHLPNPKKVLLEAYRVLKSKCYVIVMVPFMIPIHSAPADYWRISEEGLRLLLDESGFQDIHTDSWGHREAVVAYIKHSWAGVASSGKLRRLMKKENDKQFPLVCWAIGRKKEIRDV